jgi:hypothetical protein
MSKRARNRTRRRLGYSTLTIALGTLLVAVSMFFASVTDVRAMLTPEAAALRASSKPAPIVMPKEWVWRGPKPVDLEFMYGNHQPPQPDYIVMHRD